jgi:hypothetical protein
MNDTKIIDTAIKNFEERAVDISQPTENTFFKTLERLMSNPNVDPEKIKQFMDMEEHILDRNARQAFNASMTRVQNKIKLVVAEKWNNQTKSHYAPLKDVLVQTKSIYTAEGFSLMFYEEDTPKENHIRVCVDIMHEQGHTKKRHADIAVQTTGIAGTPMMTEVHGQGSAFSYGRRYLTCMIFNIPTGDDNDGNSPMKYISPEQVKVLHTLATESKTDMPKFFKYMSVGKLEEIPALKYKTAKAALESKLKATKEAEKEPREPGCDDDKEE